MRAKTRKQSKRLDLFWDYNDFMLITLMQSFEELII